MRLRDATLTSLLSYTGLRPGEALGLSWSHIGQRSILVERAVVDGALKTTKTGQRRTVPLTPLIKGDLMTWRAAASPDSDDSIMFARTDGRPWRNDDWRNWRNRVFAAHARAIGLKGARPYDLRHSAASLWIHEGRSVLEIAAWLGHKPTMTLDCYGHVMADLADERATAEDVIRRARIARPWHMFPLQPTAHPLPTVRPAPVSGRAP